MELLLTLIALIVAYLLGAIPFAYLLGIKFKGIDLRKHGSGNLGATNGIRVLGPKLGLTAGFFDIVKAIVPMLLAQVAASLLLDGDLGINLLWIGFAAAVGHCYPIYMNFKGGKAVATSIGAYLFLFPLQAVVIVAISLGIVKLTKFVSVASSMFSILFVLEGLVFMRSLDELIPRVAFMVLILWRHRSNYQRILQGTENKAKF
jgi:acyl-phosphate glycerol 3-phosphate acyltransferase